MKYVLVSVKYIWNFHLACKSRQIKKKDENSNRHENITSLSLLGENFGNKLWGCEPEMEDGWLAHCTVLLCEEGMGFPHRALDGN